MAALQGKTIKEYVLERTLPELPKTEDSMTDEEALRRLEQFLKPRIDAAERWPLIGRNVNGHRGLNRQPPDHT